MSIIDAVAIANEVGLFLFDCIKCNPDRAPLPYPSDDFGYARALIKWKANGASVLSYYQTDDVVLHAFSREVKERFGLLPVSEWEARLRHANIVARTKRAFQFPILSRELKGELV